MAPFHSEATLRNTEKYIFWIKRNFIYDHNKSLCAHFVECMYSARAYIIKVFTWFNSAHIAAMKKEKSDLGKDDTSER